jgi:hypothetical protein
MGSTITHKSARLIAFEEVTSAHRALLANFPAYEERLAMHNPAGEFVIDFTDAIPKPPKAESVELYRIVITADLGKSWNVAAKNYEQLLAFSSAPERRGAIISLMLMPQLTDPITGSAVNVTIFLAESKDAGSTVQISFFDNGPEPGPMEMRQRCAQAMLRSVFPAMELAETSDGFSIATSSQTISFSPVHQTLRANVALPWTQAEIVERLPALLPAEWTPKPSIAWLISYCVRGLTPADLYEGWRHVSERFHPVPKGFIDVDCALKTIDGLEMIHAGAKAKRGVPIQLGTFKWQPSQRGKLIARVFRDGFSLEVHGNSSPPDLASELEAITGITFEPIHSG